MIYIIHTSFSIIVSLVFFYFYNLLRILIVMIIYDAAFLDQVAGKEAISTFERISSL